VVCRRSCQAHEQLRPKVLELLARALRERARTASSRCCCLACGDVLSSVWNASNRGVFTRGRTVRQAVGRGLLDYRLEVALPTAQGEDSTGVRDGRIVSAAKKRRTLLVLIPLRQQVGRMGVCRARLMRSIGTTAKLHISSSTESKKRIFINSSSRPTGHQSSMRARGISIMSTGRLNLGAMSSR